MARSLNSLGGETANRDWKLEMRSMAERRKDCPFSEEQIALVLLVTTAVQLVLCEMWGESALAVED
ncbi:hypothetical protein [Rhizobium sp. AU243]|uniref:hypothetical protein n=1 Tax=Rhizobium sp. AU243 TaxID=2303425 RepID=UPI0010CB3224|nr:hypothetical protein [Rhizobium sp. AU243]TKV70576.1 hypothetical protein D0C28_24310 [Rhizobium sp. AU243]